VSIGQSLGISVIASIYLGIALPTFAACPTQKPNVAQKRIAVQKPSAAETQKLKTVRFAIAGMIDMDGDGQSDVKLLRRIITMGGGVIDAELGSNGKPTGKLRSDTKYLVVGKIPGKNEASPEVVQRFEDFMKQAKQLGLRTIPIRYLLPQGTRRPNAGTDEDDSSVFKQRRPPSRDGGNSSY
jgi:hypothetical protein